MADREIRVRFEADDRDLRQALDRIERGSKAADRSVERLGSSAAGLRNAFRVAGAALLARQMADVGQAAFRLGADIQETGSKFEAVFGAATDRLDTFLGSFGRMAGVSQTAGRALLAQTGAIAEGMGFASDAAADFSERALRLAADLGSFNNLETADVVQRLNAAFTGERESLKRLGIVINEADVQHHALADSGKTTAASLTAAEKAAATLAIAYERAGAAVGDLERTQDSAANKARRLQAQLEDVRDTLVTAVMPAFEALLDLVVQNADKIEAFGRAAANAIQALLRELDLVGGETLTQGLADLALQTNPQAVRVLKREFTQRHRELQEHIDSLPPIRLGGPFGPFGPQAGLGQSLIEARKKTERELKDLEALMEAADRRLRDVNRRIGQSITTIEGSDDDPLKGTRDSIEMTADSAERLISSLEDLIDLHVRMGDRPSLTLFGGLQFFRPDPGVPEPRLPLGPQGLPSPGTVPLPDAPQIDAVSESAARMDAAMERLAETMEAALGDAIGDAIANLGSLEDAFLSFIRNIRNELARQAGAGAADWLFGLLRGIASSAAGGAAGGGGGGGSVSGQTPTGAIPSIAPSSAAPMAPPAVNINLSTVDSQSFLEAQNDVITATAHGIALARQRSRALSRAMGGF